MIHWNAGFGPAGPSSVTDTAGNTYSKTGILGAATLSYYGTIYWCLNATGDASNVVTITFSTSASAAASSIQFSKTGNLAVLDMAPVSSAGSTASISTLPFNTNMGGLLLGGLISDGTPTSSAWSSTAAGSWTSPFAVSANPTFGYLLNTSGLQTQVTVTQTSNSGVTKMIQAISITEAPTVAYDPYWTNYVSLLAHGQGDSNGTTFLDSSTTNKALGRSSVSTAVTSTAQHKWGTTSISGGSTVTIGYVSSTPSGDQVIIGDFTIEFWVYFTDVTTSQEVFRSQGTAICLCTVGTGSMSVSINGTGLGVVGTVTTGTWYHVAACRVGTLTYCVFNGRSAVQASGVAATSATTGIDAFGFAGGNTYLRGYLADFRLTIGMGRYPGDFTVPGFQFYDTTTISANTDPYFGYVTLLLHGEGANGSTTFTDSSSYGQVPTASGNVAISTAQAKWGTSSIAFDGSGDYLTYPPDLLTYFNQSQSPSGTYPFTVELWFYPTTLTGTHVLISSTASTVTSLINDVAWWIGTVGTTIQGQVRLSDNSFYGAAAGTVNLNAWNHVAMSRNATGTAVLLFLNGILVSSTTTTNISTGPGANSVLRIGKATISNLDFQGYIDDVRITPGYIRYPNAFTLPTSAFPDVGPDLTYDPSWSNVSLMLHGDSFVDSSTQANVVSQVGTGTTISTSVKRFGTGSLSFNGVTGNYLTVPHSTALSFGTGDYTIEFWANWTTSFNVDMFKGSTNPDWMFSFQTPGPFVRVEFANRAASITSVANTMAPYTAKWYHIAVSRNSGTTRLFINGALSGTLTSAYNMNNTGDILIGSQYPTLSPGLTGYLDEIRMTKGVGRHIVNFVPPSIAFPNAASQGGSTSPSTGTVLLLHFDGPNGSVVTTDSSTSAHAMTMTGCTLSTTQTKFGASTLQLPYGGTVTTPYTADFALMGPSLSCTIEFWIFLTSAPSSAATILTCGTSSNSSWFMNISSAQVPTFYVGTGGTAISVSGAAVPTGTWTHVAFVLSTGTCTLYVAGIGGTPVTMSGYTGFTDTTLSIGFPYSAQMPTYYMDEVRIVKGQAMYTANFIPPTAAFANPASGASSAGTVLMIHAPTSADTTTFTDSSSLAQTITTTNVLSRLTPAPPIGTGTIEFTAVNLITLTYTGQSYLQLPYASGGYTTPWDIIGLGKSGTIECFYYASAGAIQSGGALFSWGSSTTVDNYAIVWTNPGVITLYWNSSYIWFDKTFGYTTSSTTAPYAQWNHIAVVNNAGTIKIYVNGVGSAGFVLTPTPALTGTPPFNIGLAGQVASGYGTRFLNGYMCEIRVSSTAVYTSNFTPPTSPLS